MLHAVAAAAYTLAQSGTWHQLFGAWQPPHFLLFFFLLPAAAALAWAASLAACSFSTCRERIKEGAGRVGRAGVSHAGSTRERVARHACGAKPQDVTCRRSAVRPTLRSSHRAAVPAVRLMRLQLLECACATAAREQLRVAAPQGLRLPAARSVAGGTASCASCSSDLLSHGRTKPTAVCCRLLTARACRAAAHYRIGWSASVAVPSHVPPAPFRPCTSTRRCTQPTFFTIFCSSTRKARTMRSLTTPAARWPPYARCTVFLDLLMRCRLEGRTAGSCGEREREGSRRGRGGAAVRWHGAWGGGSPGAAAARRPRGAARGSLAPPPPSPRC